MKGVILSQNPPWRRGTLVFLKVPLGEGGLSSLRIPLGEGELSSFSKSPLVKGDTGGLKLSGKHPP